MTGSMCDLLNEKSRTWQFGTGQNSKESPGHRLHSTKPFGGNFLWTAVKMIEYFVSHPFALFPLPLLNKAESVIEMILKNQTGIPVQIQMDDRVTLSLLQIWRKGRPRSLHHGRTSSGNTGIIQYEAYATPR